VNRNRERQKSLIYNTVTDAFALLPLDLEAQTKNAIQRSYHNTIKIFQIQ